MSQEQRARRTQVERRAETERRVLDAALRLIAAGGSRAMSVAHVGDEAGYSRGIVTHQFGSRDELLRQAVVHAQRSVAPVDESLPGLERMLALVDHYLGHVARRQVTTRAFLLMWAEAVAAEPTLHDIYVERDTSFREFIAGIVEAGIADGSIRDDAEPAAIAVILLGQLRGIGLQLMLTPDAADVDALLRSAHDLVHRGLRR